jgi:hypothetical protein
MKIHVVKYVGLEEIFLQAEKGVATSRSVDD